MWDLCWTKCDLRRISLSTSVSPANSHFTDSSTPIIIRDWYSRPIVPTYQMDSVLLRPEKLKKGEVIERKKVTVLCGPRLLISISIVSSNSYIAKPPL
jgi:hypothetical protein